MTVSLMCEIVFAMIALGAGIGVVAASQVLLALLYFLLCLTMLSVLWVMAHAAFLGAMLLLLYAGAVSLLLLMMVMFLPLAQQAPIRRQSSHTRLMALVIGAVLTGIAIQFLLHHPIAKSSVLMPYALSMSSQIRTIGLRLFTGDAFAVILVGMLLLGAMVTIVQFLPPVARRCRKCVYRSQMNLQILRIPSWAHLGTILIQKMLGIQQGFLCFFEFASYQSTPNLGAQNTTISSVSGISSQPLRLVALKKGEHK